MEARKTERGYWYVVLPRGPHDRDSVRLWLSRPFVPAPRCPLEGQQVQTQKSALSGRWINDCPRCGRSLRPVEGAPEGTFSHPEYPLRDFSFPVRSAEIKRTEKGSLVLVPGKGTVHLVMISSGFRGTARITKIQGGEVFAEGDWYRSPRGSLGWTSWALVHGPEDAPVEVWGERTGREIPASGREVHIRIYPDGRQEEVLDEDLEAALKT